MLGKKPQHRQRTQRALHFVWCRVDHHIEVGNGSDMAVQDDGDAADHGVANALPLEPVEDITVSLGVAPSTFSTFRQPHALHPRARACDRVNAFGNLSVVASQSPNHASLCERRLNAVRGAV